MVLVLASDNTMITTPALIQEANAMAIATVSHKTKLAIQGPRG